MQASMSASLINAASFGGFGRDWSATVRPWALAEAALSRAKAAPHAFRATPKKAAPESAAPARAKPEPVRRPDAKAVVNAPAAQAAASGGADDNWQEF